MMKRKTLVSLARRLSPVGLQKIRHVRDRLNRKAVRDGFVAGFIKLTNSFNARAQAPFGGRNHQDVPAYGVPKVLHSSPAIEINNTCNIDCAMCQTSLSTRKKGKIKPEMLERIFDRLGPYAIDGVELHTIGDPLANPNLPMVLDNLRKRSLTTAITTNGLMLGRHVDTIREYLDVVIALTFSIDGASKETYERIRLGGKWEQLLGSLELAREKLADRLPIHVSTVVSGDNRHEIGDLIVRFRDYVGDPATHMHFGVLNSLSPDNAYFDKFNLFSKYTKKNVGCHFVSGESLFFHINGDVSICCRDYDGSLVVGNVMEQSIEDIVRADKLRAIQGAHEDGDVSSIKLCDSCYVVDDAIAAMVGIFLKGLMAARPDASANFYQTAFDQLLDGIEAGNIKPDLLSVKVDG